MLISLMWNDKQRQFYGGELWVSILSILIHYTLLLESMLLSSLLSLEKKRRGKEER